MAELSVTKEEFYNASSTMAPASPVWLVSTSNVASMPEQVNSKLHLIFVYISIGLVATLVDYGLREDRDFYSLLFTAKY